MLSCSISLTGVFNDIIHLKIEAGDEVLRNHFEKGGKNAMYTSPHIQNEIIHLCGGVVKEKIVNDARKAIAYSILADETSDIAGKEQLSIGIRFFDGEKMMIREEYLGFVQLENMDAETIAAAIDTFIENCNFDPTKCVGQGYDGCNTMSGKDGGVQKILREKYTKALFFHCASHKLNLVVNDLNSVVDIRNTTSTIKEIINFFRESVLRRKYVPNIPAFCETRWSQKHKSIAVFKDNFEKIINALEHLSKEGNSKTRTKSFQLHSAATKTSFIISVFIIAKYSAILEPVVIALQSKSLDLFQCAQHIKRILSVISDHRENSENEIKDLLDDAQKFAEKIETNLSLPRIVERQQHRSNPQFVNFNDYWRISLLIPYLDSLKLSLENRFSDENTPAFSLHILHPSYMLKKNIEELKLKIQIFSEFYNLEDLVNEIEIWFALWKNKKLNDDQLKNLELCEVVKEVDEFFPSVQRALHILLAQPCTTCTIERSFSTLRRVKTWLRSTMGENRLNGEKLYFK